MHIDSLNYFFQVANAKSISTVAKNSHISQSALSQQISKLENKLNVKLFIRNNKGVSLTQEGEILFKYSESILNLYNKMQEELLNSINQKKYISIKATESISNTILPMAISKIKESYDSYTINLNTINSSNIDLNNEFFDIFISYNVPSNENGIVSKILGNDEVFLISNKNFPLDKIKKEDLLNLPLIFTSNRSELKKILFSEFNLDNDHLQKNSLLYTTNSYFSALSGILSSTNAVTFLPKTIINNCSYTSELKKIEIEDFSIKRPIYISYLESFYKSNSNFIKKLNSILKGYLK